MKKTLTKPIVVILLLVTVILGALAVFVVLGIRSDESDNGPSVVREPASGTYEKELSVETDLQENQKTSEDGQGGDTRTTIDQTQEATGGGTTQISPYLQETTPSETQAQIPTGTVEPTGAIEPTASPSAVMIVSPTKKTPKTLPKAGVSSLIPISFAAVAGFLIVLGLAL